MAVFSECCSLKQTAHPAACDDHMKHMYSETLHIGVTVGSHAARSVLTTHLACLGKGCPCSKFSEAILFDSQLCGANCIDQLDMLIKNDTFACPFMAIVVTDGQATMQRALSSEDDIQTIELEGGAYSIK